MTSRTTSRSTLSLAVLVMFFLASAAHADTSHARIIRLSYLQGDVRIAHNVNGDPLQSSDVAWEAASLNVPVHQGDVVATDNGRAEVEFESGNVAFLSENTVLEFYDLSLEDGSFTTRLIVRQGSASFYVRPSRGDYFSVTGGDFSVEANERAHFRLNNYDDGSDVQVLQGRVSVLNKGKSTLVSKGQSLTMRAGDESSVAVGSVANTDDFDQWAASRVESSQAALSASQQYSGAYDYTSGFGDLYTFGGWYGVAGYGYCWRPYGVSFGWNPFQFGQWYFDPFLGGWVFVGTQPWGWLPYHYGGWIFQPGLGWVWSPTGSLPNPRGGVYPHSRTNPWKPVTATFVHSGSQVGLVPTHPLDEHGKTPLNLREGVFPVSQRGVSDRIAVSETSQWKNFKNPSREVLPTSSASLAAPARVVRTMAAGESNAGIAVAAARGSQIQFDPVEHRFVNAGGATSNERAASEANGSAAVGQREAATGVAGARTSDLRRGTEIPGGRGTGTTSSRSAMPPTSRASVMPPVPHTTSSGARSASGSSASSGSRWGGGSTSGASSSSRTGSGGSASASSSSSSSSSRSSGGSSSSGGRPH